MANSNLKLESECKECKEKKRTLELMLLGHVFWKNICIADSSASIGVLDGAE